MTVFPSTWIRIRNFLGTLIRFLLGTRIRFLLGIRIRFLWGSGSGLSWGSGSGFSWGSGSATLCQTVAVGLSDTFLLPQKNAPTINWRLFCGQLVFGSSLKGYKRYSREPSGKLESTYLNFSL